MLSPTARVTRAGATSISRLDEGHMSDRLIGWIVTVVISAFAFGIRIVHLGRPNYLVFDETYYPKDAWTMLHAGYEMNWPSTGDKDIAAGKVHGWISTAEFVVHPPLGKWLIAAGEATFGMNSFGWRFPSLVFGTLLIAATIRLGRRLSRSTLIGGLAGLLLSVDGLEFVMSRTGLLDIFQAFFIVAGVACVVADRDWFRWRLARRLREQGLTNLAGRFGPRLLLRPWRLAAGVLFGCGMAVKWNTVFVLATMGVLSVIWDLTARRLAGAGRAAPWSLLRDGIPAFVQLVAVSIPVYLASWIPWLVTYPRQQFVTFTLHPNPTVARFVGTRMAALLDYHRQMYDFHTGSYMAHQTHIYSANPAGWLIMRRPIGIDAVNDIKPGTEGCRAVNDTCLRVISGAGTPFLWWFAAIALVAGLIFWLAARDRRFSVPILAAFSTWIPWFKYDDRPLFFFYAICIIPFTVIVLAMCLGKMLGPSDSRRRRLGAVIVTAAVVVVMADFAFIYPILTDQLMTRHTWLERMWFESWI